MSSSKSTTSDDPLRKEQDLSVVPDSFEGWVLKDGEKSEPEGYYDTQAEAIEAGRELARKKNVKLVIRGEDGTVRES